jgi:hypothetical protein
VDLYIPSSVRLHGVVLNLLSTGTTLPFMVETNSLYPSSARVEKFTLSEYSDHSNAFAADLRVSLA